MGALGALWLSVKPTCSCKAEGRRRRDCRAYRLLVWHNFTQTGLRLEKGCMLILLEVIESLQSSSEHRLMFCKVPN